MLKSNDIKFKANYIKAELEKLIATKKVGSKLTSERDLADKYNVSRKTIRNAVETFINDGTLKRIHGSGVYIKHPLSYSLKLLLIYDGEKYDLFEKRLSELVSNITTSRNIFLNFIETNDFYKNPAIINNYDGLLLFGLLSKEYMGLVKIPVVGFFESNVFLDNSCNISVDDIYSSVRLVKYLKSINHEKIMFLGDLNFKWAKRRCEGVEQIVDDLVVLDIHNDDLNFADIYTKIKENGISAIICCNDETAFLTIDILRNNGIKIPDDISVAGYDGIDVGNIKLTTMAYPLELLSEAYVEEIIGLHNKDTNVSKKVIFTTELVVGETTKEI